MTGSEVLALRPVAKQGGGLVRLTEGRADFRLTGVNAAVADMHTIKPLDAELVAELARKTGAVVTAEEHNAIGGLGDAVLAALADADVRVPVEKVAVQDVYGHSGKGDELLGEFGLRAKDIAAAALRVIARK